MAGKLGPDAFTFYVGLGPGRSYAAVAKHFGAAKRSVTALAHRERWQERLEAIERQAVARSEKRATESIEEMHERHLRSLRAIQGKALEALKAHSLDSAMDAVRALDLAIRGERTARGEPGDRTAVSVEDVIRKEYESWLVTDEDDDDDSTQ